MKDIKPCPFCGGEAYMHNCGEFSPTGMIKISDKWGIHCGQCHIATLPCDSKEEVIALWNHRVYNDKE